MSKNSGLQAAIERATSETLLRPDPAYNLAVKDLVIMRPDMPKEASQSLKKRLLSRNPKIVLLSLELLEFLMKNTSLPFHTQVASRDFLSTLAQLYRSRDSDEEVKLKLKSMLTSWYKTFASSNDILPGFTDIYLQLKLGGEAEKHSEIRPDPIIPSSSASNNRLPQAKADKLKGDLQVVIENISLTSDMITAGESANNETLVELINTLKAMEGKLLKLVERLADPEMLEYCLKIKDDLQEVIQRYADLKQGRYAVKKNEMDLLFVGHPEPKPVVKGEEKPLHDLIFDAPANHLPQQSFVPPPVQGFPSYSKPLDSFDLVFGSQPSPPTQIFPPAQSNPTPVYQNPSIPNQLYPQSFPLNIAPYPPIQSYPGLNDLSFQTDPIRNPTPVSSLPYNQGSNNPIRSNYVASEQFDNPYDNALNLRASKPNSGKPGIEENKKEFDDLFDFKF